MFVRHILHLRHLLSEVVIYLIFHAAMLTSIVLLRVFNFYHLETKCAAKYFFYTCLSFCSQGLYLWVWGSSSGVLGVSTTSPRHTPPGPPGHTTPLVHTPQTHTPGHPPATHTHTPLETATEKDGTHPTGMHSCCHTESKSTEKIPTIYQLWWFP